MTAGAAPWLNTMRRLAFLLAGLGLVISGASWAWILVAILALVAAAWWSRRPGASGQRASARFALHADGRLTSRENGSEIHGLAGRAAWVSRWFCVLRWTDVDGGRSHTSLVCASENHADDYRRLLAWLRLDVFRVREGAA